MSRAVSAPSVGIFWGIELNGEQSLLTDASPLSLAEPYGDCLTHSAGHSDVWERWRSEPLSPEISSLIRSHEYEDYPRGRVVYQSIEQVFWIYADRRLMAQNLIDLIVEAFGLSNSHHVVRTDPHYRRTASPDGLAP